MDPQKLKALLGSGLLSFPLTDFDEHGEVNASGYRKRLEWLIPYSATALFAAGGTGEFFSLTGRDSPAIHNTAVDPALNPVPCISGEGGATRFAIQCAPAQEKAVADQQGRPWWREEEFE